MEPLPPGLWICYRPAIVIMALLGLGIVWSPFAYAIGWFCRRQVVEERDEAAQISAILSLAMFLPWLYLLSRMLGKPIPSRIVRPVYVLIFAFWLVCLAGGSLGVSVESYFFDGPVWARGVFAAIGAFILFTWQKALRRFVRMHRAASTETWPLFGEPWHIYAVPFGWVVGWSAFNILAVWVLGVLTWGSYPGHDY